MEQLIIFAIIAIVSSIFGKAKNKKPEKQTAPQKNTYAEPPASEKTLHRTEKTQSFEDFAREFIGDWIPSTESVEESKEIVEEQEKKAVPSYVAPPVVPPEVPSRSTQRDSIGRLAAGKKEAARTAHSTFQIPRSKNALMQAVVMAEVLGPPKAKRK
ncbi:hypothetical protein I6G82_04580 [Lysinibacillus macroides]|uniref:Uncharacterized protein n=1 Tax=Lysinibacillus macroides TaxID=33935 RepID=A0A0N0CV47_9BACI|nr:hypothetical protein [Lysinibacillus macroides]KOY80944.1 hypothetical protein ADM90_17405 [Lysinibacillus macroides]QPR68912.1 hypothetical protein I6G82_04580 [Lysinibacillus macroides]